MSRKVCLSKSSREKRLFLNNCFSDVNRQNWHFYQINFGKKQPVTVPFLDFIHLTQGCRQGHGKGHRQGHRHGQRHDRDKDTNRGRDGVMDRDRDRYMAMDTSDRDMNLD
jgi:hypothetical protein